MAPFVWTDDPLNVGTNIKAVHITELRTNTDWLDDNCPCMADNSTHNDPVNTVVDNGDDGTHDNNQHSTYEGNHDAGADGTNYGSDDGAENSGYLGNYDGSDQAVNNISVQFSEYTDHNGAVFHDYNSGYEGAAVTDEHTTYEGGHDGTYYGDHVP